MITLCKKYFRQYRELILYVLFGGLTTVVNIAVFWVCSTPVHLATVPSTVAAWIVSVLFAYLTNRIWVFESKARGLPAVVREIVLFFGCRVLSGVIDVGIMWLFVDVLHCNSLLMKIISNILVVILNYLFSKVLIFRKSAAGKEAPNDH